MNWLKNIISFFKSSEPPVATDDNTQSPSQSNTVNAPGNNTDGQPCNASRENHMPVQQQVSHSAPAQRITHASSNIGCANWFNGIRSNSAAEPNENIIVYSPTHNPLCLTPSCHRASGGEGLVYTIPGKMNRLVKLYKNELLQDSVKSIDIKNRIMDMLTIGQKIDENHYAWPRMAVYNDKQQLIGFAMNELKGVSLQAISGVKSIRRHFPNWDRSNLASVALDFLEKVKFLAGNGILVNDFNPANFLISQNGKVSFIDCDSYQIPGSNGRINITRTYFASHVAPEFLSNPSLLAQPRNIHHVEFGAAMIIFNILMCGLHPYSYFAPQEQAACGTPDENLRKGYCPLGINAECQFPKGNWYNLWSYLPYGLKSAFVSTFRNGHSNPNVRSSLYRLEEELNKLLDIISKDPARLDLEPKVPKSSKRLE